MLEKIGEFDVVSGEVRVSDPCYDLDVWCSGSVPAVNGRWSAMVERRDEGWWGERIVRLIVENVDHAGASAWKELEFQVGVDSGQAGIFDLSHYRDDSVVPEVPGKDRFIADEPWYSLCCEATLGKEGSGIVPFGAVSSSGYGDGGYDGFAVFVDGKAVAVMVVFIEDDDEAEDDDGWDEEE